MSTLVRVLGSSSGHTGQEAGPRPEAQPVLVAPGATGRERGQAREERRHESDLSYDVNQRGRAGDRFVVVSLQEARDTVDRALNK